MFIKEGGWACFKTPSYERVPPCLWFVLMDGWLATTTLHNDRGLLLHNLKDVKSNLQSTVAIYGQIILFLVANSLSQLQPWAKA